MPKAPKALVPLIHAGKLHMVTPFKVEGGLALVGSPSYATAYGVTVVEGPSKGYCIQPSRMNLAQGKALLKRLAPMTDWSKLDQNGGNLSAKDRETLREAVLATFEELGLRPKTSRVAAYVHTAHDRQGNLKKKGA